MDNNEKYEIKENPEIPSEGRKDFVFIREEIKNRPVNKGKLARSTFISAFSAVVFGLVACLTFALVLPFATGYLGKEKETVETSTEQFIFPEETAEEEMNPEDMLQASEVSVQEEHTTQIEEEEIQQIVEQISIELTVDDYQRIYEELAEIAGEAERSIVRVRTVSREKDWFDNLLEEESETSGLIIADNGRDLFIVTYRKNMDPKDNFYVTFNNDESVRAFYKSADPRTGLCVLFVPVSSLNLDTHKAIKAAGLGSSNSSKLAGALVLAVGSPMGNYGSVNYGIITSYGKRLTISDSNYRRITTDCYGSLEAGGVLVNLSGEVIGIISSDFADQGSPNLITALGISELKKTIENMINGKKLIRFGITGFDVPSEAQTEYNAPKGAYVTGVEMDSPAMAGGIQAGDIIVAVGEITVVNYSEVVSAIRDLVPEEEIIVTVMRQSIDGYKELKFAVVPEILE